MRLKLSLRFDAKNHKFTDWHFRQRRWRLNRLSSVAQSFAERAICLFGRYGTPPLRFEKPANDRALPFAKHRFFDSEKREGDRRRV